MERNLSRKEIYFLNELRKLLLRCGASVVSLNGEVAFFIDNVEHGDCVPVESHIDARTLSQLIVKGKVALDRKSPHEVTLAYADMVMIKKAIIEEIDKRMIVSDKIIELVKSELVNILKDITI